MAPLLRTKLAPPRRQQAICRQRLMAELSQACRGGSRLLNVVAGVGYGKSLLAAEFQATWEGPSAWYQLDREDNDLPLFLAYLAEAIAQAMPEGRRAQLALPSVVASGPTSTDALLLSAACGDLAQAAAQGPLLFVLEDAHVLAPRAHTTAFLSRLIEHSPEGVTYLVTGRTAPDLPVARWRAQGWVYELPPRSLLFAPSEVAELLRHVYGWSIDEAATHTLTTLTDGWAAGLLLILYFFRERGAEALTQFLRTQGKRSVPPPVYDFLALEIFEKQEPVRKRFLLDTAVLEELTPSACDALHDGGGAAGHLQALAQEGLFTVELEGQPGTYRYHHLFREFLLRHLAERRGEAAVAALHARAAEVYRQLGDGYRAVAHLVEAKAWERLDAELARLYPDPFRSARFESVERWLAAVPHDQAHRLPWVQLYAGELHERAGRLDEALAAYQRVTALAAARGDGPAQRKSLTQQARIHLQRGEGASVVTACKEALATLAEGERAERARVLNLMSGGYHLTGAIEQVEAVLLEALALYRAAGQPYGESQVLNNLAAHVYWPRGELRKALQCFSQCVALAGGLRNAHLVTVLGNQGELLAALGRPEEALEVLKSALALADELGLPRGRAQVLCRMGEAFRVGGDWSAATAALQEALALATTVPDDDARSAALSGLAIVNRRMGNLEQAIAYGEQDRRLCQAQGNRYALVYCLAHLALAYLGVGDLRRAAEAIAEAWAMGGADGYATGRLPLALATAAYRCELEMPAPWEAGMSPIPAFAEAVAIIGGLRAVDDFERFLVDEAEVAVPVLRRAHRVIGLPWVEALLARLDPGSLKAEPPGRPAASLPGEARPLAGGLSHGSASSASGLSARQPAPALLAQLFGPFELRRGGVALQAGDWPLAKARWLFCYLALQPGVWVPVERIWEVLWPSMSPRAAGQNFRVTLHELRKVLEPDLARGEASRFVTYRDQRCRLEPTNELWIDVSAFCALIQASQSARAAGDTGQALEADAQAVELYRADLLDGERCDEWVLPERERLRGMCSAALGRLLRSRVAARQWDGAMRFAQALLSLDPCREDVYRLLMRIAANQGLKGEVDRWYRACCEALQREMGTYPSARTRRLREKILVNQ